MKIFKKWFKIMLTFYQALKLKEYATYVTVSDQHNSVDL